MATDNKTLGKFILDGIPPAPRGVPQIEVTFKIDANGILNVSAKDKATGKEQSITITASTQMDDSEIDRLVKEAAEHAAEDKKKKDKIETKNEAESLIFQTEKFIKEFEGKIDASDKEELEKSANELKEMIGKDDFDQDEVKKKKDELTTKLQEKGAKMYEKAGKEAEKEKGDSDKGDKGSSDKEPVEGEVVDEKKDKDDEGKK